MCTVPFHCSPSSLIAFSPVTLSRGGPLAPQLLNMAHSATPPTTIPPAMAAMDRGPWRHT
jgi:hypothetical protein